MSAETPSSADSNPESSTPPTIKFTDLALSEPLLRALSDVGYESPSPIQAATIPPLLEGRDVLGQAQTGTGKTAAFALPILARIDPGQQKPQALVLAPTRELAIQVAEAFQKYAASPARLPRAADLRRPELRPAVAGAQARRARRRRHARAASSTTSNAARWTCRNCAAWCSTKPTRCCAWASSTTSRRC